MPLTVVLAVGLDWSLIKTQEPYWKSAGYIVTLADSLREAVVEFESGDFDLILFGDRLSTENQKQLTFLIRSSGSLVPVARMASSTGFIDSYGDAVLAEKPDDLPVAVEQFLARKAGSGAPWQHQATALN